MMNRRQFFGTLLTGVVAGRLSLPAVPPLAVMFTEEFLEDVEPLLWACLTADGRAVNPFTRTSVLRAKVSR